MKQIAKIIPYIIYVIVFSIVCSLASALHNALSAWSLGYPMRSFSSVSDLVFHFPKYIFYAVLQVVAAVVTVRRLSLRKLFYLSCVFSIVGALLVGLDHSIMKILGGLFFPLFLAGQFLPYVAPVIVLALMERKKIAPELVEAANTNGTTNKIKTLYSRYWYVLDVLLIIVVFLYGTLNDPFGFISYFCGLYNRMIIRFMMTFVWVMWLIPAMLCFGVLLLRILLSWPKYIENKSKLLFLHLVMIVGLGVYFILPFIPVRPSGISMYIKGFETYIRAEADITGLRRWLDTLGPEDCVVYNITSAHDGSKSTSPKDLQEQEWPAVINELKPRYVRLSVDDEKNPKVRLNWGSGFLGSWGLVVGQETMPTPESDLSLHGEYRKEICKGAYIWHGLD